MVGIGNVPLRSTYSQHLVMFWIRTWIGSGFNLDLNPDPGKQKYSPKKKNKEISWCEELDVESWKLLVEH
jgi:hypothetical protein